MMGQPARAVLISGPALLAMVLASTGVAPSAQAPASAHATLDKYCVTCHNDRLKTGGLTL